MTGSTENAAEAGILLFIFSGERRLNNAGKRFGMRNTIQCKNMSAT